MHVALYWQEVDLAMSKLVSTLYRLLLRRANQLDKCGGQLNISMPIDKSSWLANGGGHAWATPAPGNDLRLSMNV